VSSTEYLRDLIRVRLGFDGVLHCDWQEVSNMVLIHKVAGDDAEALKISLEE
jgi:beta-glucosidase-like glycosyl hydrolase